MTLYQVLIVLSVPFAVLRLFWKSRYNPDYRQRLTERISFNLPDVEKPPIWIHSVSVGEFIAMLPLIQMLLDHGETVLITTTTPTGSALVREKLGKRVYHCYLPFDLRILVRLFVRKIQPRVAVFVETEIWPNYVFSLKKNDIPVLLINARLSERSYAGYQKLGEFSRHVMACFTEVACQNKASEARFQQLGANTSMQGNIKFDIVEPTDLSDRLLALRTCLGQKKVILAASTHSGEERLIIDAYQNSDFCEHYRLVVAPRHPERSGEVLTLLQHSELNGTLYSDTLCLKDALSDNAVVVVDKLGELLYFYAAAEFAIVGGSFVANGGHNPLEAALFATPCVIGEHYFNFETLVDEMVMANAIKVVSGALAKGSLNCWLDMSCSLTSMGNNAQAFLHQNQGAIKKYMALIQHHSAT